MLEISGSKMNLQTLHKGSLVLQDPREIKIIIRVFSHL